MKQLQKLPIGIQSFETIRENSYLYVDKTEYIYRMIDQGMFYFISRPRRFGKSLMVSTLRALFQGKKELFEGLWIAKHGQMKWRKHPVILIDFNEISHDTPQILQKDLENTIVKAGQVHNLKIDAPFLKSKFKQLVMELHEKTGMPVVILVDEYDKPIIDHVGKGQKEIDFAIANRETLKNFLGVIKGGDVSPLLRFVFITGISRFSRVSIFSELNNLNDISMNRRFADMFGYTHEELGNCFRRHLKSFAGELKCDLQTIIEKLKRQYNGYRFSKKDTKVYNPFSILKAFDQMDFQDYWFETGTPAFLINLLREKNYYLPEIEGMEIDESMFTSFEIDNLKLEAVLFQTGYITIKDIKDRFYLLDYPNQEVKNSFLKHLLSSFTHELSGKEGSLFLKLAKYLHEDDFESFFNTVNTIFASIPYTINTKRDEAYFHTLFYLMVSASGVDAKSEVLTSRGRIDMVIEFSDKIFIMEFKCNQSATVGIRQIKEKGYADKYRHGNKKLYLMALNFSTEKRNLSEWKIE